jgi:hypothetical protein
LQNPFKFLPFERGLTQSQLQAWFTLSRLFCHNLTLDYILANVGERDLPFQPGIVQHDDAVTPLHPQHSFNLASRLAVQAHGWGVNPLGRNKEAMSHWSILSVGDKS